MRGFEDAPGPGLVPGFLLGASACARREPEPHASKSGRRRPASRASALPLQADYPVACTGFDVLGNSARLTACGNEGRNDRNYDRPEWSLVYHAEQKHETSARKTVPCVVGLNARVILDALVMLNELGSDAIRQVSRYVIEDSGLKVPDEHEDFEISDR
jgi:hypothetical protein